MCFKPALDTKTSAEPGPIKVGIVDDHAVIRSGLREFFSAYADLHVVGEGSNGREALGLVARQDVDVLLMDLCMPGQNGLDALAALRSRAPQVRVLILTGYPATLYALNILKQGARGFLHKNCEPEDIVKAIRQLAAGELYLPRAVRHPSAHVQSVAGQQPAAGA